VAAVTDAQDDGPDPADRQGDPAPHPSNTAPAAAQGDPADARDDRAQRAPRDGWAEERRRAVAAHAAAQAAARSAEAATASALLADFVREAASKGLRPQALRARSLSGRATYRTRLRGWYLRADRSVAVGEDGRFYVLSAPASWRARWTGAELRPSEPRLVLGAGGGDGEAVPLDQLLRRRLDVSG
jgi:hypothetical protein